MKKAVLFKKKKEGRVQCQACFWHCCLSPGERGICGVRENQEGELFLLVWGYAVGLSPDPVEKKPLYHFLPGKKALSFGTLGCNFGCLFCQNWFQSQSVKQKKGEEVRRMIEEYSVKISPKEIVLLAEKLGCPMIAYTYNEPAIFIEYARETMILAKKKGLKNIFVSNGFESQESFSWIKDYLDGINIDLKSFNPRFYRRLCRGELTPVLDNIERFLKAGIWLEVTTLIIPGENDSSQELNKIARFLSCLSPDIPWHVTAFYPDYQMVDRSPTPPEKLIEAWEIGKENGLRYVYVGNIDDSYHSTTWCPFCGQELIKREGYQIKENRLKRGRCPSCQRRIAGVWQ